MVLNSFYSIHGRVVPVATGIKLTNPDLNVIGFEGDGDAYDEGLSHVISGAKRNTDITLVIHDNRIFALTTGQFTPTSPEGFHGKSTPGGSPEEPINPIALMLTAGATFVARVYAGNPLHFRKVLLAAIKHKGFSFVDVLQPCISFFNTARSYNQRVYKLEDINHNSKSFEEAMERAREWNYSDADKDIPIGIFYQTQKPTYEELVLQGKHLRKSKISNNFSRVLKEKI